MSSLATGLLVALVLALWGAQAVVPWRLRRADEAPRRAWARTALPLFLGALLAALLYLGLHPDAAFAAGLSPLLGSRLGRLVGLLAGALLAGDLVLAVGGGRLERQGWPIAAAFGLASLAAASLVGELLRAGDGPSSPLPILVLAAACRLLVALGAGELFAPGRPLLALVAGLALPLYLWLLPATLRHALGAAGGGLTLAASTLLFLAARFLPAGLRRPGIAAAVLLAGLFLGLAADLSQTLAGLPLPPLAPLTRP